MSVGGHPCSRWARLWSRMHGTTKALAPPSNTAHEFPGGTRVWRRTKEQLSLGLLAGVGRATAPWGCSQPQAQSNLCALVHRQPGKRFMRPGADAPQGSLHAIDHTPQSRTGKSELIRVRAIVVGLPLRNKAANRSLFMDHNQCPWVGVTAEQPVFTVHRRRCPLEQPLGILFSHIDATAAHRRAEVAVPSFA